MSKSIMEHSREMEDSAHRKFLCIAKACQVLTRQQKVIHLNNVLTFAISKGIARVLLQDLCTQNIS